MQPAASIVITNYNYARYLREAVESALAQHYPSVEVVIVDDGSIDESREIIASYGARVVPVMKTNGGQGSAFNAGFRASSGDLINFLDADDVLLPGALAAAAAAFERAGTVKVQWPLWAIDADGRPLGKQWPQSRLSHGDLRDVVLAGGPASITSPPTSGNVWARSFLERVLPMPEDVGYYRICADEYLYNLAPVLGRVETVREPQGLYRLHGRNIYSALTFAQKVALELKGHEEQCSTLGAALRRLGFDPDIPAWRETFWFRRLQRAIDAISARVPEGSRIILVDDASWGADDALARYEVRPFLEDGGVYAGPAGDEETAVRELRRMRREGAHYMAFGWSAFWWLSAYQALERELADTARCMLRSSDLILFDLAQRT